MDKLILGGDLVDIVHNQRIFASSRIIVDCKKVTFDDPKDLPTEEVVGPLIHQQNHTDLN